MLSSWEVKRNIKNAETAKELEQEYTNTIIAPNPMEQSMKLEPKLLDVAAVVANYHEHIKTVKDIQEKIAECKLYIQNLNDKYESALQNAINVNQLIGLHEEQITIPMDGFVSWEANCRSIIEKILTAKRSEIDELKREEMRLHENITAIREMIVLGVKMIIPEEKVKKTMCPICFDKEINMVLSPCGHTLCQDCSTKIERKCMTCRGHVAHKMNIYFSI